MNHAPAKEKILNAAFKIIREEGVAKLTLDRAAKIAGLSKGGVLYHFNTKDDLIKAMLQLMISLWENLHQEHAGKLQGGPERYLKAMILTAFDPKSPHHDPAGAALLAAISTNPELVQPWRDVCNKWVKFYQAEYPDPSLALLIGLVGDGLLLHDLIGLDVLSPEVREALKNRMLQMAEGKEK